MEQLKKEEIQQIQLEILDFVDRFCTENNITYYLTGGSLIGALRHNGFIPWDDDIDIMMYRDEYEVFIKSFNEKQTRYHAFSIEHDDGYNYHFCKVCDTKTLLIEGLRINDIDLGVNIDVFPLDKLPDNVNETKLLSKLHTIDKMMYCKAFRLNNLRTKHLFQRIKILACKLLCLGTTRRRLGEKQSRLAQQFKCATTTDYALLTCHIRKQFPRIDRKITKRDTHVFEDRKFSIPSTYDRYLTLQFGDYMTPPPPDKQIRYHDFIAYRK